MGLDMTKNQKLGVDFIDRKRKTQLATGLIDKVTKSRLSYRFYELATTK